MIRCPNCSSEVPEGSRFCPSCGVPFVSGSDEPTRSAGKADELDSPTAPTPSGWQKPPSPRTPTSDSLDEGRFIPGTMLAGRYRIVGLLGRGGMGEVYRAEDLKLGQPVALKFLPEGLDKDAGRLDRFLNEVKVARQVSHSNVCRMHDVGETDGQHFLSMEYVDGEDLSSLLLRIGRLPGDKAVQVARQICMGLHAAHEQGILHRDLKPANVMIDGRGRVKITDFGLAGLAEQILYSEVRDGTPAYMAPEQLSGAGVSVQSDLFALGLVLFEMFTGKSSLDAATLVDPGQYTEQTSPMESSELLEGIDPDVQTVIRRCLQKDPETRPRSALAVSAALPGGDPLAAALAAGETPSPEMVAAAGPKGGMKPKAATACVIAAVVSIVASAWLNPRVNLHGYVPFDKSVSALTENARGIVRDLGYVDPPTDSVSILQPSHKVLNYLAVRDSTSSCWEPLRNSRTGLFLMYRQSPKNLIDLIPFAPVSSNTPSRVNGDISLGVDLQGRLVWFLAKPGAAYFGEEVAVSPDGSVLFDAAGLNLDDFEPTRPTLQRSVYADTRAAWTGFAPILGEKTPVRVEASFCRGKPVYFEIVVPWDSYWSADTMSQDPREALGIFRFILAFSVLAGLIAIAAVILVVRNFKTGRGDKKGAFRVAAFIFALVMLQWVFSGHHVVGMGELLSLVSSLANSLMMATVIWALYMALEPYVRRLWPEVLISWTRLLAGKFRDPLIGRDLLAGYCVAGVSVLLRCLNYGLHKWLDSPPRLELFPWLAEMLHGGRKAVGQIFTAVEDCVLWSLGFLLLFVVFRIIFRRHWLAAAVFVLVLTCIEIFVVMARPGWDTALVAIAGGLALIEFSLQLLLLLRFGILAASGSFLLWSFLNYFPVTTDFSAPYFSTSLVGIAAALGIILYAFVISRKGQPVINEPLLAHPKR